MLWRRHLALTRSSEVHGPQLQLLSGGHSQLQLGQIHFLPAAIRQEKHDADRHAPPTRWWKRRGRLRDVGRRFTCSSNIRIGLIALRSTDERHHSALLIQCSDDNSLELQKSVGNAHLRCREEEQRVAQAQPSMILHLGARACQPRCQREAALGTRQPATHLCGLLPGRRVDKRIGVEWERGGVVRDLREDARHVLVGHRL
mmetsp:Transcript_166973/g.536074  ORF Transcript_166973/g.536074 Transcript_166973/m.536074 type:complete len:201 (+) Transcript_166973:329-931(+)